MKIHQVCFITLFSVSLFFTSCNKDCPDNELNKPGCWQLTFSEEFAVDSLNKAVWTSRFNWGQNSYEDHQQLYIDSAFEVKNGRLYIECKRQTVVGMVYDRDFNAVFKNFEYTSGLIHTQNFFAQQYGYFEIRCKIPYGNGFWPAFWLLPLDDYPPEIDVFEFKGSEPTRLHMAHHFENENGIRVQHANTINGPNFSTGFHVIAIEWNVKEIKWYIDGQEVFKSEVNIPQEKLWLVVNLALGGGYSGYADKSTPSPAYLEVDYIRVYQKKG